MRVLFFLRKIGPYHDARIIEASKVVDLVTVETRPGSREYSWDLSPGSDYRHESFPVVDVEGGIKGPQLHDLITKLIDKYQPQVIVTTGWADHEYHAVAAKAIAQNIPLTVISDSRYEDVPRRTVTEFVKKLILRSYSSAIVAGTASRNYLVRLGFGRNSIFSPWDVIDNDYFFRNRKDIAFDDRYFLCVSRFIEKKNLPALITAYADYRSNGGRRKLVFAGDGHMEDLLRAMVSERNLGDVVTFQGFVQYAGLPSLLSRSLCLVLPSTSDQWGLVVNEAMASGVPVLVSKACGCAVDLVEHDKNGFIFDPFITGEITKALEGMNKLTEVKWKEMSVACLSTISGHRPSDFANALRDAAEYALGHPSAKGMKWIHKLLGK